jgi:hypothetical protein
MECSDFLVFRGSHNGWEPFLSEGGRSMRLGPCYGLSDTRCVCVRPPFRAASHLALEWLRGRSLASLLSDLAQNWRSCHEPPSGDFPVNGAREPSADEGNPLHFPGVSTRNFPEKS